jgi:hypothetical protein
MGALMKDRIGRIVLGVILVLGLTSCQIDTSKWQTVYYNTNMSFKVPDNWVISETDEGLVFSDKSLEEDDYKIFMIEIHMYTLKGEDSRFDSKLVGNGIVTKETYGEASSLSTYYSEKTIDINGQSQKLRTLYFAGKVDPVTQFLVLDNTISSQILRRILSTHVY